MFPFYGCCRCEFRLILNLLEIKIHNAVENISSYTRPHDFRGQIPRFVRTH